MEELLAMMKRSIGRLDDGTELDAYYTEYLNAAKSDLATDDISEDVLATDLGKRATVLYAIESMNGKDIASHTTINLLRNKLAAMTRGERYADGA